MGNIMENHKKLTDYAGVNRQMSITFYDNWFKWKII